eukprot:scaffold109998_cov63-Attheya_sp.AAC.5
MSTRRKGPCPPMGAQIEDGNRVQIVESKGKGIFAVPYSLVYVFQFSDCGKSDNRYNQVTKRSKRKTKHKMTMRNNPIYSSQEQYLTPTILVSASCKNTVHSGLRE